MAEEVHAPLAGNLLKVLVEVGTTVEEDDELLIIEALKMENIVYAHCDGEVASIHVKEGNHVEDDELLITLE